MKIVFFIVNILCLSAFSCLASPGDSLSVEKVTINQQKYLKLYCQDKGLDYFDSVFVWVGASKDGFESLNLRGKIGYDTQKDCNTLTFPFADPFLWQQKRDSTHWVFYNFISVLIPYQWNTNETGYVTLFYKKNSNAYTSRRKYYQLNN
jgi:hypothetical protein